MERYAGIGGLAALMALVLAATSSMAISLKDYPTFFTEIPVIVVGENAKTIDVVGAINIAVTLAELSYKEVATQVTGAAEYDGLYKVATESELQTEFFEKTVKPGTVPPRLTLLKDYEISYEGENYRVVEQLITPVYDAGAVIEAVNEDEEGNDINGYYILKVKQGAGEANALKFRVEFKENITLRGSIDKTLDVDVAGTTFRIINVTNDKRLDALVGQVVWLKKDEETTIEGHTIKIGRISSTQAEIWVDGTYNVLGKDEEYSTADFKVKVLKLVYWEDAPEESKVKLVAGKETEKIYGTGDEFPGNEDWTMHLYLQTPGQITKGDYIEIYYAPEEDVKLKAGESVKVPGGKGELRFIGPKATETVKVEFKPVSLTVYSSDLSKKLGTIKTVEIAPSIEYALSYGGEDYKKLWIGGNATSGEAMVIAYDEKEEKYYLVKEVNLKTEKLIGITITAGEHEYEIILANNTASGVTGTNITLNDTSGELMRMQYRLSSDGSAWILGSKKGEAEAADVIIGGANIGDFEKNYLDAASAIVVENVKSNADDDKVVVVLPGYEGKPEFELLMGAEKAAAPAEGEKVKQYVPITEVVGYLDTDANLDPTAHHVIIVGGPYVNRLAAQFYNLTWPVEGMTAEEVASAMGIEANTHNAVIEVREGVFAEGKIAMVVAGWYGEDTRAAARVVQNHALPSAEGGLADVDAAKVIITETLAAKPTITPA